MVNAELAGNDIISIALADACLADTRVQFASMDAANTATRPQLMLNP